MKRIIGSSDTPLTLLNICEVEENSGNLQSQRIVSVGPIFTAQLSKFTRCLTNKTLILSLPFGCFVVHIPLQNRGIHSKDLRQN